MNTRGDWGPEPGQELCDHNLSAADCPVCKTLGSAR